MKSGVNIPWKKTISVIICTYNRAHLLERTLRTLSRQTMRAEEFEIIVVDGGSDDDTAEVCDAMRRELPNVRYIAAGGPADFIAGANMGFRRSVLEELNGFEESASGTPDTEFILRARQKGYRMTFAPDAVVIHDPDRTTWSSIFRYASELIRFLHECIL